jgi:hypothetical protein
MELEDYFHQIQQEKPMIKKDTVVSFSIDQDNSDLEDFADTFVQMRNAYSGPTWMQILEDVIKVLETNYGYDIKSKVFYAIPIPIFDHNVSPAPGRELDQKLFLELLEQNPELNNGGKHQPQEIFSHYEE